MRLPVSGLDVRFRAPDGNDDLAILEAAGNALERAFAVLPRLAGFADGAGDVAFGWSGNPEKWAALTVTDFEMALLGLRRQLFGDRVGCVFRDVAHKCGVRMEIEFSIAEFIRDVRPATPRSVRQSGDDPQWFQIEGEVLRFRLPTVEDQLKVLDEPQGAELLRQRCVDAPKPGARALAKAERAMEVMAPLVSRPLAGVCPECGETVTMSLHVPRLLMEELELQSSGVHKEIDRIASAYHWDEASILAMPQGRRGAYAEAIVERERVRI